MYLLQKTSGGEIRAIWCFARTLRAAFVVALAALGLLAQAAQPSLDVLGLVILRGKDGVQSQLNVSYKGQLQAGLNAGEYTVMPVCHSEVEFEAVVWAPGVESRRAQNIEVEQGFDVGLQVMLVEVSPSGRVWVAPQPRASVNWSEWALHSRVVSRVKPQCAESAVPMAALVTPASRLVAAPSIVKTMPVVHSMELASDVLFPFGASTIDRRQVDTMLRERLRAVLPEGDVSGITEIKVIGHSDPEGGADRKTLVSRQRAQEVADYLQSILGISPALFSIEAQSDKNLLVANCPRLPVVQRNACNAPNRRVEILISIRS